MINRGGDALGRARSALVGADGRVASATNNADRLLNTVRQSIRVLLDRSPREQPILSYERIYAACRHLVLVADRGSNLSDMVREYVEKAVSQVRARLMANERTGAVHFETLATELDWFERQIGIIQSVLAYLDRVYLPSIQSLRSIR